MIGDARADRYKAAVRTVLEDENVDMGIVILTPQSMTDIEETAAVVPEAVKGINKPVVCSFMGAKDVAPGVEILRNAGIPNYPFPEDGVRAWRPPTGWSSSDEIPRREMPDFNDLDVDKARRIIAESLGRPGRALPDAGRVPAALRVLPAAAARRAIVATSAAEAAQDRRVVRHAGGR